MGKCGNFFLSGEKMVMREMFSEEGGSLETPEHLYTVSEKEIVAEKPREKRLHGFTFFQYEIFFLPVLV